MVDIYIFVQSVLILMPLLMRVEKPRVLLAMVLPTADKPSSLHPGTLENIHSDMHKTHAGNARKIPSLMSRVIETT